MTAQHTPGPWIAYEWECSPRFNEDGNRFWGIKPEKFHYGAEYLDTAGWMSEANARLIAEAPAMLEALRSIRNPEASRFDRHSDIHEFVDAILARIDGGEK